MGGASGKTGKKREVAEARRMGGEELGFRGGSGRKESGLSITNLRLDVVAPSWAEPTAGLGPTTQ